jgi:hypothetical protein
MRRAILVALTAMVLPATRCEAIADLTVKVAGTAPDAGATVLAYVVTNTSSRPYALVRVDCTIEDPNGTAIDQASDVIENIGARQSAEGHAYFNTAAIAAGTTFACRVGRAYR